MDYYRDSVTQKSWELLRRLRQRYRFVVIGGWAVWLYSQQLKSKDIDIVVELNELGKLSREWEMEKNDRLKKYQFRRGEVEVDVYVPYYSNLGVPAEKILADTRTVNGFLVPAVELLIVLKSITWAARRGSAKGRKDWIDLVSLLGLGNLSETELRRWQEESAMKEVVGLVAREIEAMTDLEELGLNRHQVSRLKKQWLQLWKSGVSTS